MARPTAIRRPLAARLILDSGAVPDWSRGEPRLRARLLRALELGCVVRIPVAVLAETLRGGPRDAPIHRVRNAVDLFATDERIGRLAGELLGRTGGSNAVDAPVAAEAILATADVLTGDPHDFRKLLAGRPALRVLAL